MKRFSQIAIVAGLMATPSAGIASALSDDEIRTNIAGRRIHLAVPLGGEFPLNYRRGGIVDGNGEALGLGRFVKPSDSGRWWIRDAKLCQQFKTWYNGDVLCFRLSWTGERKLRWVRDNGDVGTARIGERIE